MAGPSSRTHRFVQTALLKRDLLGTVARGVVLAEDGVRVPALLRRSTASLPLRPVARWLAAREARALRALEGVDGVPRILARRPGATLRSWIEGESLHLVAPPPPDYWAAALRLVGRLHRAGLVHDDLHKEANWIVRPDGRPALVDFQLALAFRRRGRLFRLLAREDLRHLLKHKRKYAPDALGERQRRIVETPSAPSRLLRATVKRLYRLVTRRILRWSDTEGRLVPGMPRGPGL